MRLRHGLALALALGAAAPAVGSALSGSGGSVQVEKTRSGFDAAAQATASGATVRIGGPAQCTKGGRLRIDVTITQRASGALARGTWTGRCRGSVQRWTVRAARALTGRFVAGEVTACAAAAAASAERATDALQWCKLVTLRK
jgi:hypothetical protein